MQITKAAWLLASLALTGCTGTTGTDDKETDTETDTVDETDDTTVVEETDDTVETDTEPADACLASAPVLRVGTGESQFIEVPANSDIYMVSGGQGGWHVPISIEVENATESIHYKIRGVDPTDDTVLIDVEGTTAFVPTTGPGGTWECDGYLHNLVGFVAPETYSLQSGVYAWEHLCGDPVRITVTLYTIGETLADLTDLVSTTIDAKLQPDPCDCDACGAVVIRQCAETNPASPRYNEDFVRACDQSETDLPDTDSN